MNYEDEEYVRYYTRDTVSWMALGWEGQAVLALMLHGKFDRSGVFDCDGHDPSHAVTIVTRLPEAVTKVGLKALLDSKTWVHRDGKIVWPKFSNAQHCRRSDRARQLESREKRRSEALGSVVTPGDNCDGSSPGSSVGHPEQSRADQSRAEEEDPPTPLEAGTGQKPPTGYLKPIEDLMGVGPAGRADVMALHERYKLNFKLPHRTFRGGWDLDAKLLAEAIDAHTLDECLLVADFAPDDGMVSGRDDENKRKHTKISYIFGNEDTFSRILAAAKEATGSGGGKTVGERMEAARKRGSS